MGENSMNYINNNGKRVLDHDSRVQRQQKYLEQGGLYPFVIDPKSINGFGEILKKKMKSLNEPYVLVCKNDYHKEIFALLLLMICNSKPEKYFYYKVIGIDEVTQNHLDGEFHDSSEAYESFDILFVKLNYTDFPHMYNAYCIRNLAQSRKEKGKYTFFFFWGNASEFLSDKWKLRDDVRANVENTTLLPLTKYISYIDLNKCLGGDKK